jgi:murein DD-endopeptidase MepM/ murein hydrolase activator NlpD
MPARHFLSILSVWLIAAASASADYPASYSCPRMIGAPAPASAQMTAGFGARVDPFTGRASFHQGVDFSGPLGTPVYAAMGGAVKSAQSNGGYGVMVEIDHGSKGMTRYAHLKAVAAVAGMQVRRGQVIGAMGISGRSLGPQVHFELWCDGKPIDPASRTLIDSNRHPPRR